MSERNRRQFLEDSMFAAAAVAATNATPLLAEEEKQSGSANEKLSVAVAGVRGRGGSHIGAFAGRRDTEVTYICDPDEDVGQRRAVEVAKRQGGRKPKWVADIRKVRDDKNVDIVSIATPNHWHALAAIWSIQAGKDVYVEKPVSHNVSEGRRIVEAARKYDRICQTGTQCRSNRGMRDAMAHLHDGGIGKIKVARGLCYKPRGSIGPRGNYEAPTHIDYDLWLGPAPNESLTRPQFHYDWHWQWPYGNGDLGNQGIHQMDLARWGLGVNKLSNSVTSYGGRFTYTDAGDTANTQVVIHDYGDQALVFEVRGLKTDSYKGARVGVIFEGEDGYLVMTSYSSGSAFDLDGKKTRSFSGGGNHFENFLKAVRSRKHEDLTADIEEGHLSSALCHMGNISYRHGVEVALQDAQSQLAGLETSEDVKGTFQRVLAHLNRNKVSKKTPIMMGPTLKFHPETETFASSESANAMLTREYRKPFVVPSSKDV